MCLGEHANQLAPVTKSSCASRVNTDNPLVPEFPVKPLAAQLTELTG